MGLQDRHRINRDEVIDEVIDGEVVMIRLTTGSYYCTNSTGALVWEWLGAAPGVSVERLADAVTASCDATNGADVAADVDHMVGQLAEQQLIVTAPPPETGSSATDIELERAATTMPYEPPALETFTDLQDLLLLDPVHDVGPGGWPRTDG